MKRLKLKISIICLFAAQTDLFATNILQTGSKDKLTVFLNKSLASFPLNARLIFLFLKKNFRKIFNDGMVAIKLFSETLVEKNYAILQPYYLLNFCKWENKKLIPFVQKITGICIIALFFLRKILSSFQLSARLIFLFLKKNFRKIFKDGMIAIKLFSETLVEKNYVILQPYYLLNFCKWENKKLIPFVQKITGICIICLFTANTFGQQNLTLENILSNIQKNNPEMKMYKAQIRYLDEAAKGARSWEPPEFGAGLFMTPYNLSLTKSTTTSMGTENGMGSFMITASQMFPNKKEQNANADYLQSLSFVNKENQKVSLNNLYAEAKKNYYDWLVIEKKQSVLNDDEKLLNFMIQSTELRYKNNLGKLNAYYKAKAELGKIENQREVLKNEIKQKQIMLNTLMNRDKNQEFEIDTNYMIKTYPSIDSNYLIQSRSDIKAVEQDLKINQLELNLEKTKQLPQFGIQYDHMIGFGKSPWQFSLMAMVKIPLAPWSAGSYKASIESLKWKQQSFEAQKQMILNQASGEAESLVASINSKKRQLKLFDENIIPALKKNYQVMQLAYEQNTGELFELLDAWQTLNLTQLEYLDQLQEFLNLQVQLDRVLEIK